jgi:hypothetical protein
MSCFYLCDNDGAPVEEDQVSLKMLAAPVASEHRHTGCLQMAQRLRFSPLSY